MREQHAPPRNGEGPGARERSEPSGTSTVQPNCALVRAGDQGILNATPEHAHFERATLEGIANSRQRRAVTALLARSLTRKQLDDVAGCNNSPDLVMKLREFGLQIPCTRQPVADRDGKMTWYGIYSLTAEDKTIARTALGNGGRK